MNFYKKKKWILIMHGLNEIDSSFAICYLALAVAMQFEHADASELVIER